MLEFPMKAIPKTDAGRFHAQNHGMSEVGTLEVIWCNFPAQAGKAH